MPSFQNRTACNEVLLLPDANELSRLTVAPGAPGACMHEFMCCGLNLRAEAVPAASVPLFVRVRRFIPGLKCKEVEARLNHYFEDRLY